MPTPIFFPGDSGNLFGLINSARQQEDNRPAVLFLPPFADEMNKARRMMARLLYRLQEHSIPGMIFDPYGTGDSAGDFSDATVECWVKDVGTAARYLMEAGASEILILAVRAGGLIARAAERDLVQSGLIGVVYWQPVTSGKLLLNQFLRLRLAAGMSGQGSKESVSALRAQLESGKIVEVGGYGLNGRLAEGLEGLDLASSELDPSVVVAWAELVPDAARSLLPASQKVIERWRQRGLDVSTRTIVGPHFWSTVELVDVPELIDWSLEKILSIADRDAS